MGSKVPTPAPTQAGKIITSPPPPPKRYGLPPNPGASAMDSSEVIRRLAAIEERVLQTRNILTKALGYTDSGEHILATLATTVVGELEKTKEKLAEIMAIHSLRNHWIVGRKVKPKYRVDQVYNREGIVLAIYPDGYTGLRDKEGILQIYQLTNGLVYFSPMDKWVTA